MFLLLLFTSYFCIIETCLTTIVFQLFNLQYALLKARIEREMLESMFKLGNFAL